VIPFGGIFKSLAYRITISVIYLLSGLLLAFSDEGRSRDFTMIGWVLMVFGLFRLLMAVLPLFRKN
jgi:hypothetical protein